MRTFRARTLRAGRRLAWSLVVAGVVACNTLPATALELRQDGLSFSDEGGGFVLKSVSGTGTLSDPFVVLEEVTDPRQAVLVIRGMKEVGNRIGTHHIAGVAVTKVVINRTDRTWQNFQLELRELMERHSSYEDGLSFAQNTPLSDAVTTSSFPIIQRIDEPQDTLAFSGKFVQPGDSATFSFLITDMSPVSKFFLVQQPLEPVSETTPVASPAIQVALAGHHMTRHPDSRAQSSVGF
jgi:hypothetical protein